MSEAKKRSTEHARIRNLALEEAAEVAIRNGAPMLAQEIRKRMDIDPSELPNCSCDWEFGDAACKAHPGCESCGELYDQHADDCSKTQFWARQFGPECAPQALEHARAEIAAERARVLSLIEAALSETETFCEPEHVYAPFRQIAEELRARKDGDR